jgi:hypothetical protein
VLWASSLQAILALGAVLALLLGCAKLAQRLPMVRRLHSLHPKTGLPVSVVYPLDARSQLRIVQFAGTEYRILHSGGASVLLEQCSANTPDKTPLQPQKMA